MIGTGPTILVTGVRGFLGRHLARALSRCWTGARVVGVDRQGEDAAECRSADLADRTEVRALLDSVQPRYIFHCAGLVHSDDWRALFGANVETTIELLDAAGRAGDIRVIVPGSAAEYGAVPPVDLPVLETQPPRPVSLYGLSKLWQTAAAAYYADTSVDVVVARIFNVIGTGMSEQLSLGTFCRQLRDIRLGRAAPVVRVGNLDTARDFLDVIDVCEALIALARGGTRGHAYNVCSGEARSLEEILRMMIHESGASVTIGREALRLRRHDVATIRGSNRKIREDVGWAPRVPLETSVRALFESPAAPAPHAPSDDR